MVADFESYKRDRSESLEQFLLPNSIDAEEAVLGGILIDAQAMDRISGIVKPEYFYSTEHQIIFQAAFDIYCEERPIDLISVSQKLSERGSLEKIGGTAKIAQLVEMSIGAVNVDFHAELIAEKYKRRTLIQVLQDLQRSAFKPSVKWDDLLSQAEERIFALSDASHQKGLRPVSEFLVDEMERIDRFMKGEGGETGLATGFYDFDAFTQGLKRKKLYIVAGRPGMAKCLGKGTRVIMADGTLRPVEDVRVGDLLMGDDSSPRKVLSIARGQEMMYWVRQNRGVDYRVNEGHILSLKRSRNEGGHKHGDVLDIPIAEYLSKSTKFQSNYKGYKVGFEMPEQPVPVDPYFLGLWLGDGTTTSIGITNPEPEVAQYIEGLASDLGHKVSVGANTSGCPTLAVTRKTRSDSWSLQSEMRSVGLIGSKHIPQVYLSNSTAVRLRLLAGLLDTDGHYQAQFNVFEISQKSKSLIDQIKFLCDSLGFATTLTPVKGTIKSIGFSGDYWRLRIFGNLDSIPTQVARKQARPFTGNRDWTMTGITIEQDCIDDYYGFALDGNHRFLLEDGTVTHNSSLAAAFARNIAGDGHPVAVFSLEMDGGEIVRRLLSSDSSIDSMQIESGDLTAREWESLGYSFRKISDIPLYIDESEDVTPSNVLSQSRLLKSRLGGLGAIVIDYLHLMLDSDDDDEVKNLGRITRACKKMSRALDVPVVLLSQLNRGVEAQGNKRPSLASLRGSGSIEQDADMVIFLYRDEYYDPNTEDKGIAEVIISKNRGGKTGVVKLLFEPQFTRFRNMHDRNRSSVPPATPRYTAPQVSSPVPTEPTIVQSDSIPALVEEVEEEDWEDEPLEPQVDQWREDNGVRISIGKTYMISLDRLDEEGRKELRKTPDFDRRSGVGKRLTITGWDDSGAPYWAATGIDEDGETRSIDPFYLVEVSS